MMRLPPLSRRLELHIGRCGWGLPALIKTVATRAARTRITAPQAVATEKPWTKAAAWAPANPAAALTATVYKSAVPSEPPTWLAEVTVAEATHDSRGSTLRGAVLHAGTIA